MRWGRSKRQVVHTLTGPVVAGIGIAVLGTFTGGALAVALAAALLAWGATFQEPDSLYARIFREEEPRCPATRTTITSTNRSTARLVIDRSALRLCERC
jgi:hypothetical protein